MLSSEMKKQLLQILKNDISKGDVTSTLLAPKKCTAKIVLNENAYVSGLEEAKFIFSKMKVKAISKIKDGNFTKRGKIVMALHGSNKNILSTERTVLNILGRMSGVTSKCAEAKKIAGNKTQIAVTRKTSPGFNLFDKKAARIAGVWEHRENLNTDVLIKENHLKFFKTPAEAVITARKKYGKRKKIEVEVETIKDALSAAAAKPHIIMLDNFSPKRAKKAIRELRKTYSGKIELSGGISLKNLAKYKNLRADIISMGSLTTDAKGINFSLEI